MCGELIIQMYIQVEYIIDTCECDNQLCTKSIEIASLLSVEAGACSYSCSCSCSCSVSY